jgi:hypothetical protein
LKEELVKLPRNRKLDGRKNRSWAYGSRHSWQKYVACILFFFSGRDKTILNFWKVRWVKIPEYMPVDEQHERCSAGEDKDGSMWAVKASASSVGPGSRF